MKRFFPINRIPKMNANHKAAAEASKTGKSMFVVYVPDEGEQVFDTQQMIIWSRFVVLEAAYLNGQRIADMVARAKHV